MNYKALTIGGVTQDIFITYYEDAQLQHLHNTNDNIDYILLRDGGRLEIEQPLYACGGGALNTATTFAKLGFDTSVYAMVGNDQAGERIQQYFVSHSINAFLQTHPALRTGHSFILPGTDGNRIVFAYRGANTKLTAHQLPISYNDVVYCAALPPEADHQLPEFAQRVRESTPLFVCNPGLTQLQCPATDFIKALENIDILIVNGYESKILLKTLLEDNNCFNRLKAYKPDNLHDLDLMHHYVQHCGKEFSALHYCYELLRRGPHILVITNGQEGVYVATPQEVFFHPSLPAKPVNTVGAGDAFGACFAASLVMGYSIHDACIRGLINSASILHTLSSHEGILDAQQLDKIQKTINSRFISIIEYN